MSTARSNSENPDIIKLLRRYDGGALWLSRVVRVVYPLQTMKMTPGNGTHLHSGNVCIVLLDRTALEFNKSGNHCLATIPIGVSEYTPAVSCLEVC